MVINTTLLSQLRQEFNNRYGTPSCIVKAPGRVNIIGEHTDYNGGTVLPFAISQSIYLIANNNTGGKHHIYSSKNKQEEILDPTKPNPIHAWSRFFYTAIALLRAKNYVIKPCSIVFDGNLPGGAGLSSSSAITCGFISALNQLNDLGLSKIEIVKLASISENSTGIEGGKMDQMCILFGEKGQALEINCNTLSHKYLSTSLSTQWLIIYSNVNHQLVDSDYNNRVRESNQAFKKIQLKYPELRSFTALKFEHLQVLEKGSIAFKRIKHFISEEARVKKMLSAIQNKNHSDIGAILYESHQSLSRDYNVSCPALDFIVDQTKGLNAVYGARMIGGGFGGSVIALIQNGALTQIKNQLDTNYQNQFNKGLDYFIVKPEDGLSFIL